MKRRTFLASVSALFIPTIVIGKTIIENKITPPTEEEDFYQFFLNFNGFPITDFQKALFEVYKMGHNSSLTYGRQGGVSTFQLTLAAWLSSKGKSVIHVSTNLHMKRLVSNKFKNNIQDVYKYNLHFITPNIEQFRGRRVDEVLFDRSGIDDKMFDMFFDIKRGYKCFMIGTSDLEMGQRISYTYEPYHTNIRTLRKYYI